ncbi:hypothetical protein [Mucilaginibacter gotjawali]|uniref:Uncharacterized protein n=2 Tax=Mucilaginibacter gotjawali TaxID=1550579 RepID=A0A839SIT8_9SPHI|nr:hypothetical protein [Mucilaginibacter gotjawali]MBB3057213.1 hypothetical protein [Mucilaginibacter gotjawali]BAU53020.1 hypothetical protein MgSA37_01187 [Mucilaginibacter gotjawali]
MANITAEPLQWSTTQKVAFRFFLLFFLLFIFFDPNGVIPFTDDLFNYYIRPFHSLIPWLAKHILHLAKPITIFTNGSGDTTYDYVTILFLTFVSGLATMVWSITGRNTSHYNKLLYWLTVVIRYYVAITMVTYGSIKVIKLQFPVPSLSKLVEPMGNMSPMGLAWSYLGLSTGFNYFAGCAELACGMLLFFRKTTTLGAIIGLVVAGNIMAINYCFDVPVKILSTFLVLMCIFLLVKDHIRLINFFFRNREALPANLSPHRFKTRWKNITLCVIKYAAVIYVVIGNLYSAYSAGKQYGDKAKRPPLYGLYKVDYFVKNKDTLPPLTTDTLRWSKFIVSLYDGYAQISYMNDSLKNVAIKPDTVKHQVVFNTYTDTLHKFKFTYTIQKPGVLVLAGKWKQDSLHIRLRRYNENDFLLLKRGFHWVNEYPLNR